jgi:YVTN family beta-propeller protein
MSNAPRNTLRNFLLAIAMLFLAGPLMAQIQTSPLAGQHETAVIIAQTSSGGSNTYLIDPLSKKVIGIIEGLGLPHGITVNPEGSKYYVTNEHDISVDVVDARSLEVIKRIPLAARPNNIASSSSARKVYAAIAGAPMVQVIDMDTDEVIKSIATVGGVHNTFATPDGRYIAAGMVGARTLSIIDTSTDEIAWSLGPEVMKEGVRPMGFETNADGSTKRIFVNLSSLEGFVVVDFEKREVVEKIVAPRAPLVKYNLIGVRNSLAHGIEVLADQSAVWVVSRVSGRVIGWTLPDLEWIGDVDVGVSSWLTSTPDSRYLYVATTGRDETAVIDLETLTVIDRIKVGDSPKRMRTFHVPADVIQMTKRVGGGSP